MGTKLQNKTENVVAKFVDTTAEELFQTGKACWSQIDSCACSASAENGNQAIATSLVSEQLIAL
jgi:hypothetical protein